MGDGRDACRLSKAEVVSHLAAYCGDWIDTAVADRPASPLRLSLLGCRSRKLYGMVEHVHDLGSVGGDELGVDRVGHLRALR